MALRELYLGQKEQKAGFFTQNPPVISFEIFPPKDDENGEKLEKLIEHLNVLKEYSPAFISLTYGAGGTTQNASLNIIQKIQNELSLDVMPHFTCVCHSKEHVKKYLKEIQDLGIKNILALRGDIPAGVEPETFDFRYANELVEFIKLQTVLSVAVAGYPEGHMDCPDLKKDLVNLKLKIDAGGEVIYTQMFFDNDKFLRFCEYADDIGIKIPIIPGILPIMSYNQLSKMLSIAKVTVPKVLMDKLEKYKDNPDDIRKIGIDFASYQCQQLIDTGVKGLHFFTLNTSSSVSQILNNLEIKQEDAEKLKIFLAPP
ncbi:MAG: methylenetetrahydrofolate reductase [NAD(P)H] [Candidatus Gastranaerophilales bacterium]|nr:methylenetetrahydrofolate reductase [NAD(P)H] [Candidatus Gastranaerophilales bacterium]